MEGDEKEEWEDFWKIQSLPLLLYSCKHGTVDVVKFFVSSGVDPTEERFVHTQYIGASKLSLYSYILLSSLSHFSSKGHTPLSCAAEGGHHETVTYLLGVKGVSPNGSKDEEKQKKVI